MKWCVLLGLVLITTPVTAQVYLAEGRPAAVKPGEQFVPPLVYREWWDSLVARCHSAAPRECPGVIVPTLDKRKRLVVQFDDVIWRSADARTIACTREAEDRRCWGRAVIHVFSAWNADAQEWKFRVETTITLAAEEQLSQAVVTHEMLHVIMVTSAHPAVFRILKLDRLDRNRRP